MTRDPWREQKNFAYFGSAAFVPRHAAEVGVVFPAGASVMASVVRDLVSPTHTSGTLPPPHSCGAEVKSIQ